VSNNKKTCSAEFVYDPKAEAKLVRKIDLMIVPTVALLYLFCFIDRANIGKLPDTLDTRGKKNQTNTLGKKAMPVSPA
jgi:hypothetical protein